MGGHFVPRSTNLKQSLKISFLLRQTASLCNMVHLTPRKIVAIGCGITLFIMLIVILSGIKTLEHDDQFLVHTSSGENVVFLEPTEQVVGKKKNKAIEVNREQAVLVLSNETGQQRLVTEKGIFVPGPYEEILEIRTLIHIEPHEAVAVRMTREASPFTLVLMVMVG